MRQLRLWVKISTDTQRTLPGWISDIVSGMILIKKIKVNAKHSVFRLGNSLQHSQLTKIFIFTQLKTIT